MADGALHTIEGIAILPSWSDPKGGNPSVFILLQEFYRNGNALQSRALTSDEARGLAQLLTLAAEAAERGPGNRPKE
jgi:hypothetical protein